MSDSKWIEGLQADQPVLAAARQVLLVRLGAVRDRLPKAVQQADEDVEHVHQLRVSTRRAAAALRIFDAFIPPKAARKARKTLRRIRRAAGAARDWDVFLESLAPRIGKGQTNLRPGIDVLIGIGHGQRLAAQVTLREVIGDPPKSLDPLISATISALRSPHEQPSGVSLRDLAVPMVKQLVMEVNAAAGGDLSDYEHLHQVRILGKQLRYAMEIFATCFPESFRADYYAAVEEMQEILGRANDSHVASQRLAELGAMLAKAAPAAWKRYGPGIEGLQRHHERRLPQERKLFLKWWAKWRSETGEGLLRLLAGGDAGAKPPSE